MIWIIAAVIMGWFNKVCEYIENEEGFKSGFVCTITGRHISTSDQIYKEYCDAYGEQHKYPFHPERRDN